MDRLRGRCPFGTFIMSACLACIPGVAAAQAALAGAVTDPSGAFVSGVIVEASSPVLLERRRDVTTDGAGRYRIEDLRPGTYLIRFSGAGWQPLERDGIVLSAGITTTVDAGLSPAGVNESVHVSAAVPLVDRYTGGHIQTLSRSTVSSLPVIPSYNALLGLVPGVVTSTNDVVTGTASTSFPIHGGRTNEGRLSVNGFIVGSPPNGNSATSYSVNVNDAEQITFVAGGGLGEQETAGLVMDLIPRRGGNAVDGSVYFAGTGKNLVGDNLTPTLQAQHVTSAVPLERVYDLWGSVGGPVFRNRLWYFVNAHAGGYRRDSPNVFYNLERGQSCRVAATLPIRRGANTPTGRSKTPAPTNVASHARDQISGYWDRQSLCRTCTGATPGLSEPQAISPEAVGVLGRPLKVWQATWSSPVNEPPAARGGLRRHVVRRRQLRARSEPDARSDPRRRAVRERLRRERRHSGPGLPIAGLQRRPHAARICGRRRLSYVTGAHSLKVGYQHTLMTDDRTWMTNDQNLTYRFNNGVPNQLTESISPWVNNARAAWDGLFVQDQWTRRRLTLQGAAALRSRVELVSRSSRRGRRGFCRRRSSFRKHAASTATRTSRRAWARPTTLRQTAGPALKVSVGKYLEGVGVYRHLRQYQPDAADAADDVGVRHGRRDAGVDRREHELRPRLRSAESGCPGSSRPSGGDLCGVMSNTKLRHRTS